MFSRMFACRKQTAYVFCFFFVFFVFSRIQLRHNFSKCFFSTPLCDYRTVYLSLATVTIKVRNLRLGNSCRNLYNFRATLLACTSVKKYRRLPHNPIFNPSIYFYNAKNSCTHCIGCRFGRRCKIPHSHAACLRLLGTWSNHSVRIGAPGSAEGMLLSGIAVHNDHPGLER